MRNAKTVWQLMTFKGLFLVCNQEEVGLSQGG